MNIAHFRYFLGKWNYHSSMLPQSLHKPYFIFSLNYNRNTELVLFSSIAQQTNSTINCIKLYVVHFCIHHLINCSFIIWLIYRLNKRWFAIRHRKKTSWNEYDNGIRMGWTNNGQWFVSDMQLMRWSLLELNVAHKTINHRHYEAGKK